MAAVIYLVAHSPSTGATTTLICSKTKVAPLKRLTIPRLELTAALLLAKQIRYVQATLNMDIKETYMWTDSQVALTWIKTHASRWKDYVRNRVSQIQKLSADAHWRFVPGSGDPADCASRGVTTAQLEEHTLWWTGPSWITQSPESWPTQPKEPDEQCLIESRPGISLFTANSRDDYHWDLMHRYSSLNKLLRLTALCFQFVSLLRNQLKEKPAAVLTLASIEWSRIFWIKATQSAFFAQEIKILNSRTHLPASHAFNRLTAFMNHQGVIRVGGRLNNAALTFDGKHPAILPRHSRLSELIIDHAHKQTLHGGTQLTLAHIRQSYWVIGGRAPVKSHILRCVVCARQRGIRAHQLMGQLPLARVTPSRAFTHTGIDYAGPFTLKTWKGRGAKTQKG
ncbi:hypothetical protein DMN91_002357 [Ooceraea biroi]|uniref:Integrase zinc-binding domain-containing protein n=1 Tax=Ooceraea biroi TaxID=2015173 RepID=A0A3L8E0E5_OOCBI|nr:hypothetical protein DMN91_002357 [Ooceraea biroi]